MVFILLFILSVFLKDQRHCFSSPYLSRLGSIFAKYLMYSFAFSIFAGRNLSSARLQLYPQCAIQLHTQMQLGR